MGKNSNKIIKHLLQFIIIGVIFYYLGRQLYNNWDLVTEYEWQLNIPYLILSVISLVITLFIISIIWSWIIASFGKKISYAKAFKISYLSNLGRYIPGKVWQVFGFVYLAKKEGINDTEALTAFGLALTFTLPPAFTSGILYLLLGGQEYFADLIGATFSQGFIIGAIIAMFLANIVLVIYPRPIEITLNFIFKLLKRPEVTIRIDKALAIKLFVFYFLAWTCYGFSFWLFLYGILAQSAAIFPMMGLFIIAYQIGYLALFAPGGVGPREIVLQVLLAPFFGPTVAAAIAIAARIWVIVAEVVSALIALLIK